MTSSPLVESRQGVPEPDPVIEAYKKDVDLTLIRAQLQRSVDERIQAMLGALALAEALAAAGRRRTVER